MYTFQEIAVSELRFGTQGILYFASMPWRIINHFVRLFIECITRFEWEVRRRTVVLGGRQYVVPKEIVNTSFWHLAQGEKSCQLVISGIAEGMKMIVFRRSLVREWIISMRLSHSMSSRKSPCDVGSVGLWVIFMVCRSWDFCYRFHVGITFRFCIVVYGKLVGVEFLDSSKLCWVNIGFAGVRIFGF